MHHLRLSHIIAQIDDNELVLIYDRLFQPGPSRITAPLPKRSRKPLETLEADHWMHQAIPKETIDKAKEMKANAEGKESPKKERRKGSQNIPIVAQTPGQISKSIVKRCDPCNRRRTTCITPEGSKRCTCCAKKGTQCTYGKQIDSKERSKGRKFNSLRR